MSLYSATILADNPQAYYRLDETGGLIAHDQSANGNNGVLSGVTLYSQPGAIAGDSDASMSFSSTGGVVLPYTLNPSTWSTLSFEYWINLTSGWQYVVVTTSNVTGQTLLYLNGAPYTSGSGDQVLIDTDFSFSGSIQAGSLDEVAVYNDVLSPTKISNHYLIGSIPTQLPTPNPVATLGLSTSGPVIPCVSSTPFYMVGGVVLDSQPFVSTAPTVQDGMVPFGSTFVLLFSAPSGNTQVILANGSIVTLRFRLFQDVAVSGLVSITSMLTGSVFQVNVTTLETILLPLP